MFFCLYLNTLIQDIYHPKLFDKERKSAQYLLIHLSESHNKMNAGSEATAFMSK